MGYILDIKKCKNGINITFFTLISFGFVFYNADDQDESQFDFVLLQLWKLEMSLELGVHK